MRAAVLRGRGELVVEEWPIPAIGSGELLLRLRGCGLCGSDIAKVAAADLPPSAADAPVGRADAPVVLGHEVVGEVVHVGPGVAGFTGGDRVVAAHHVPCGTCHFCRRDSSSMCRAFKASNLDPGGFSQYVRLPGPNVRHATFRIPDHLSDEEASFVEPLACCLRAMRRGRITAGDTVVVAGLGSIGLLFIQLVARAGATAVGLDPLPDRAGRARALGAHAVTGPEAATGLARDLTDGRGADQVIVTGGGAAVLPWAAATVRDGATIHFFAGGAGALPIDLDQLYRRELTVMTTYSSSPAELAAAFELIAARKIAVAGLVTHRVSLERLAEAIELVRRRQALKVYVTA
jgi:L-iditol 2-dehydrogenase